MTNFASICKSNQSQLHELQWLKLLHDHQKPLNPNLLHIGLRILKGNHDSVK